MRFLLTLVRFIKAILFLVICLFILLAGMGIVMTFVLKDSENLIVTYLSLFITITLSVVYYFIDKFLKSTNNSIKPITSESHVMTFETSISNSQNNGFVTDSTSSQPISTDNSDHDNNNSKVAISSYVTYPTNIEVINPSKLYFYSPRKNARPSIYSNYVVVDLETTGFSAQTDDIVEIAAVRFENFEPVDRWSSLVKPFKKIPKAAIAVHGITDKAVENAPQFHEVKDTFLQFVGDSPIVGHNFTFDHRFLCNKNIDLSANNRRVFDTLPLGRKLLRKDFDVENHKLGTLCEYFSIPIVNAHRAEGDCEATGHLFKELIGRYISS